MDAKPVFITKKRREHKQYETAGSRTPKNNIKT